MFHPFLMINPWQHRKKKGEMSHFRTQRGSEAKGGWKPGPQDLPKNSDGKSKGAQHPNGANPEEIAGLIKGLLTSIP